MNASKRIAFVAMLAVSLCQSASAQVVCRFHTLSSMKSIVGVDHAFRVTEHDKGHVLQQRYADGYWHDIDNVQLIVRPGFWVFFGAPEGGAGIGRSRMLTVHTSGYASLAIHHGTVGGGTQIARAWLYQGECDVAPTS